MRYALLLRGINVGGKTSRHGWFKERPGRVGFEISFHHQQWQSFFDSEEREEGQEILTAYSVGRMIFPCLSSLSALP